MAGDLDPRLLWRQIRGLDCSPGALSSEDTVELLTIDPVQARVYAVLPIPAEKGDEILSFLKTAESENVAAGPGEAMLARALRLLVEAVTVGAGQ